jgi:hypothetical protein
MGGCASKKSEISQRDIRTNGHDKFSMEIIPPSEVDH